jgi:hypothetical protein
MGEQTRTGENAARSELRVEQLFRGTAKRAGFFERTKLSVRLITGLFCAGMASGILAKSLVPGAFDGVSEQEIAQMDTAMVGGGAAAINAARTGLLHKTDGGTAWTITFTAKGKVVDVKPAG